ncbi:MAG: hypothetical protein E7812_07860 [Phenylobacterium sp.]|nr:MAG: hypothetical protein E7812_07860 [Phenylobacterium sp.]
MSSVEETIAIARAAWREADALRLAASPLGAMGEWVRSGRAPPLAWFEAADFGTVRKAFNREWGFAIPCAEAVDALARLGPLLEVGAGSGYWSAILAAAGCDVIATDALAEGNIGYGFHAGRHFAVRQMTAVEAVRAFPHRAVLCSWPTPGEPWALGAARCAKNVFALVGEPKGGVTGSPGLYRYLATRFDLAHTVAIPQFPGSRDALSVYRRR